MTHDSCEPSSTSGHHPRGDAVWSAARADYLAGGSASEVCERHGLSLSTFRWRARNEGWRRADQPETPIDAPFVDLEPEDDDWTPPPYDPFGLESPGDCDLDRVDPLAPFPSSDDGAPAADIYETPLQLAELAWAQAARAVRRGRMIEARGWTRLYRELAATRRLTTEEADSWKRAGDDSVSRLSEIMDQWRASVAARADGR
ncbi:MAG: hypothetical protein Q8M32_07730 [Brevundimonas sp.]|nr:hypothetical protein [Brevundimonas sp.]